ncbi:MAG: hypothetical protein Q7K20_05360 [Polaromonas sp.]|jgi:hypothetical protein|nr:hypothetical protein [Polaromonas sp.]
MSGWMQTRHGLSVATTAARLTGELAMARNQLVAQLATDIVVAHASPGGALASLLAAMAGGQARARHGAGVSVHGCNVGYFIIFGFG